jgi:hypothetical protein
MTLSAPTMQTLFGKNIQELRNLTFKQIWWREEFFKIALNDGQCCGTENLFYYHIFPPSKKITKVEVIIHREEFSI